MSKERQKVQQAGQTVQQSNLELKKVMTVHQKMIADVGPLLKTINKSKEYDIPDVSKYLALYAEFSETMAAVLKDSGSGSDLTEERVHSTMEAIAVLRDQHLEPIYEDLIAFGNNLKDESYLENLKKKEKPKADTEEGDEAAEEVAKNKTTKEEKNAFALSVLQRVKTKLDGREPDAMRKSSVQEQVCEIFLMMSPLHFS